MRIYECDWCGKQQTADKGFGSWEMPNTWLMHGGGHEAPPPQHFCSEKCYDHWLGHLSYQAAEKEKP